MRVLITGGFGFVGGRLAEHLAQAGHYLLLGSRRRYVGTPSWLKQGETVQTSWEDDTALEQICRGIDVVIHAAGMNTQACALRPLDAFACNGDATARLVEAAGRAGVRRFIYISTAHVYASPLVGTITEETCSRNQHPYATSHLAGEHAVLHAVGRGLVHGLVLRLSNAFGPPMHQDVDCWTLLVNDLCRQAVATRTLVLQTSGLQQRNFIGLTSVCRIVKHLAIEHCDPMPDGIVNVGGGGSQTVLDMARLVQWRCERVLGFKPSLERPKEGMSDKHLLLDYRIDRLMSFGLASNCEDNVSEIDNLLIYCQSTFA